MGRVGRRALSKRDQRKLDRHLRDLRPTCKVCEQRWVPPEGIDAGQVPCGPCRKRLGMPRSWHGYVIRLDDIEVWVELIGDAGKRFRGHARCGVHHYDTGLGGELTRVAAFVAALGLLAAHLAGVAADHGDSGTFGPARPPAKKRRR